MNSFIPWVGGKGKLLWIINKLMPDRYTRFIDVFGGSGTVTMCRPIQRGCMEVYNDNKSVTIPPAVLTVCGLDDEGKLEMAGAKGAVILSKSEMTAMWTRAPV